MNSFLKNKKVFAFKNIYAFTLVEIMVVVLIITIIASLAMISYTSIRVKSRDIRRVSNINTLQTALNAYYKDHGVFPTSITPGQPLRNSSNSIVYLDEVPSNPQPRTDHNCPDSEFIYKVATDQQSYSLSGCVGADGDPNKGKLIYSTKEGIFHCGDKITDRDGFEYKTVSIGTQCWMAENLRTRTLPNGSCINMQKRCEGSPRICENDLNCKKGSTSYKCINYNPTMEASNCSWTYNGIQYASSSRADGLDCISTSGTGTQGTKADCDAGRTLYSPYEALQCQNSSSNVDLGGCSATSLTNVMCCAKKPGSGSDLNTIGEWKSNQNVQGLCPNGWHIPTDQEFSTLETFLTDSPPCNPNRSGWECQGAGTKLKKGLGGSSGFDAELVGRRRGGKENTGTPSSCIQYPNLIDSPLPDNCGSYPPFPTNTKFADYNTIATFITTSIGNSTDISGSNIIIRELSSSYNSVSRRGLNIGHGRAFSVRCIKD